MDSYATRAMWCWLLILIGLVVSPINVKAATIDLSNGGTAADPNNPGTIPMGANPYVLANNGQTTIGIYVQGGEMVNGMNLNIQVADGGADTGGTINGPKIVAVNYMAAGAVFSDATKFTASFNGAVSAANPSATSSQFWSANITATSNSVNDMVPLNSNGGKVLLATVTFDTTGLAGGGTYALILDSSLQGTSFTDHSMMGGFAPTIVDGFIQIAQTVPEPGSLTLLGVVGCGFLLRRRRFVLV